MLPKPSHAFPVVLAVALTTSCATPQDGDPVAAGSETHTSVTDQAPASNESPWAERELPFEKSDGDRAYLGTGFTGYFAVPADTGYDRGVRVAGVIPEQAISRAGLADGDIIVELAGTRIDGPKEELIQVLRAVLAELAPDTQTTMRYHRDGEGIVDVKFWLGRQPPNFAQLETPADWFVAAGVDEALHTLSLEALALDSGRANFDDTLQRHRDRFDERDLFRLKETVQAQLNAFAHEALVENVLARGAVRVMAGLPESEERKWIRAGETLEEELDVIEGILVELDAGVREAVGWTDEERAWVTENMPRLTERIAAGEYLYGDEDVERERANRRLLKLLERVDRVALAAHAERALMLVSTHRAAMAEFAMSDGRPGRIAVRDTPVGRIEVWGDGNQRHKKRCAYRFDLGGDDNYLDCAGRADLTQPISFNVDMAGNDTYGSTASFSQGAALGGIGVLWDSEGDDQYLGREWCQAAAVAGVGVLIDRKGDDTYRGREASQAVALVGAAVLGDADGNDTYSGDRFCQGVGFAGGVAQIIEGGGNDRYSCTGKYDSEYGEPGVFSGWGQGVGFGFRRITSGGIGVLHDHAGDDVYEAGNFSQGGAYFFAWGIFKDDAGDDRYIGSRYAQGYAAHQAAGTFLEGGGDDVYQSHASVAQGLSWDETTVFFRDRGGNDRYQTASGFSLGAAAHNGIVVFVDDAGDDHYASRPSRATPNTYHGGHSFALFVDRAGDDTYGKHAPEVWNDRAAMIQDRAYIIDLPGGDPPALRDLLRDESDATPTDAKATNPR